jgi:hypothetical protein
MNKIKNISLLCALLSAGSAAANPILTEDGTAFRLNFPQEIVDEFNRFIAGVEQGKSRPCDTYAIELSGNRLTSIDQGFPKTVEAMVPYIDLPWEEVQTRLQETNVARVYKTLVQLHDSRALVSANAAFAFCIKTILNYFFDQAAKCPPTCCGTVSFLMRKIKFGQEVAEATDDYVFHLDEIIQAPLRSSEN